MPLRLKPKAIAVIEKSYHIEICDEEDLEMTGLHSFRQNDDGHVISLKFREFKGIGLFRLGKLPNLKSLTFSHSSLQDLTALNSICPNLEYLSVSHDRTLENIAGLRLLKKLRVLDISNTRVWDISPLYNPMRDGILAEFVAHGTDEMRYPPATVVADASITSIIKYFDETWLKARQLITECIKQQNPSLDLGFCGITDLSQFPELMECTHLEKLILSNEWPYYKDNNWDLIRSANKEGIRNNLFYIPNDFQKLVNLKELYISGDWNTRQKNGFWNRGRLQHFHIFTKLQRLEYLNVSNQDIRLVSELEKLLHIQVLHLNNNRIRSVAIKQPMPNLKLLFLSNNFLKDISFLNNCQNLTTVDLHHNAVRNLLPIKGLIQKLGVTDGKWSIGKISIGKNINLQLPPYETVAEGTQNVLDYFDRWEKEQTADLPPFINTDVKIILVGNSSVGKTTLANWLSTGVVDLTLKSTHWLNQTPWKATLGRRTFNVHIFDFGGQEYYHDTHHLFFTTDSVYLLLWDKSPHSFNEIVPENSDKKQLVQTFPLGYWLDSITYFANRRQKGTDELKIDELIVSVGGTTADQYSDGKSIDSEARPNQQDTLVLQSKVDQHSSVEYLDQQSMYEQYPRIYGFGSFSLKSDHNLIHIKDLIYNIMRAMPLTDLPMLGSWGAIKTKLENSVDKFKKDFSIAKFQTYCNDTIIEMPEMYNAGEAKLTRVLFNERNTRNFAKYLSKIGLVLYFPENDQLKDKVFLNQNHLLTQIHTALNAFTDGGIISKKTIAKLFSPALKANDLGTLVELMIHFKIVFQHPADSSELIAPLYLPKEPIKAIQIFLSQFRKPAYRYQFKAFIHRNVVLEFFGIFGQKTIREGTSNTYYFWRDGLVLKDEHNNEIVLVRFSTDEMKENVDPAFIDVFSLDGRKGAFLHSVIADLDRITEDRQVEKCVTLDGKSFIPLSEIYHAENNKLYIFRHRGVYYKLIDFKEFLQNPTQMKNIFISYSKDDLSMVNTFIKHLAALQRDGVVGHWYCTELLAGDEWDATIQQHFDESDIICFMVSPNFMKTAYIFEHEIKRAFERKASISTYKIIPIILDFCRWKTREYDLTKYTALPYTAKPIADFDNKNAAWYLVEEAIRIMIEDEQAPETDTFYSYQKLPSDVLNIFERIKTNQRI